MRLEELIKKAQHWPTEARFIPASLPMPGSQVICLRDNSYGLNRTAYKAVTPSLLQQRYRLCGPLTETGLFTYICTLRLHYLKNSYVFFFFFLQHIPTAWSRHWHICHWIIDTGPEHGKCVHTPQIQSQLNCKPHKHYIPSTYSEAFETRGC